MGVARDCRGDSVADALLQIYGSEGVYLHFLNTGDRAVGPDRQRRCGVDRIDPAADAANRGVRRRGVAGNDRRGHLKPPDKAGRDSAGSGRSRRVVRSRGIGFCVLGRGVGHAPERAAHRGSACVGIQAVMID